MSLRREVLDEVTGIADRALSGVIDAVQASIWRRQAEPCLWQAFHRRMVARLPRRARIRRAWHRMRGRRYEALCYVEQSQGNPVACALCGSVGRAA